MRNYEGMQCKSCKGELVWERKSVITKNQADFLTMVKMCKCCERKKFNLAKPLSR